MTRYDKRVRALAACLSAIAGYVDAVAFVELRGFFVSFMSGNSTRLGVGIADNGGHAALAGGLIASFVLGVVGGSVAGSLAGARRPMAVLCLVALLLAMAAAAGTVGAVPLGIAAMALAMGAENAVFEREGEVRIGLTYMTGTLVKLGQRLAAALLGGARTEWVPYLLLWSGLVAGAALGAAAHGAYGLASLWFAAAAAIVAAMAAARLGTDEAGLRPSA